MTIEPWHNYPAKMRQVFSHLIANAMEVIGKGGVLGLRVRERHGIRGKS